MLSVLALATAAAAAVAVTTTQPAPVSAGQRQQIEEIVHNYILEHPEVLTQAMERLRAKHTSATVEAVRPQLEKPYGRAWEGAANGDVIVVEFFDYACGYCRTSLPDIEKLIASDPRVKVVYRELPILSDLSTQAARVSMLVATKGNYPAFHKALFNAGRVSKASILASAQAGGISSAEAEAAMMDKSRDSEIDANIALAQKIQANGTPTFVIGNQVLGGAVGFDALKAAVAAARAK